MLKSAGNINLELRVRVVSFCVPFISLVFLSELLYALLCPGPLLTHPLWSSVEFSIGISLSEEKLVFLWLHCNYPRKGLCAILEPPQVTSAVVALAAAAWVVTRWRPVPHFHESNLSGKGQSLQTGLCKSGWERVRCYSLLRAAHRNVY